MVYDSLPEEIGIAAASIDEKASTAPLPNLECHIYVDDKPSWYEILDKAPQRPGPTDYIRSLIEQGKAAHEK